MNDAANRAGSGTVAPRARRVQPAPADDEGLETGEPIEEESAASGGAPKIKARVTPFDGRAPQRPPVRTEPSEAPAGQMVLTTAKYLPQPPAEPNPRRGPKRHPTPAPTAAAGGNPFGGKWGGLLAMVGAVVWFMAGLMTDTIYFYPPVLFVIGLGAFMKGATKSD